MQLPLRENWIGKVRKTPAFSWNLGRTCDQRGSVPAPRGSR